MVTKRCYQCGYKLTPPITYNLFNTAIHKVVPVCKDCHTAHLRMRAKQKRADLAATRKGPIPNKPDLL